MPACVSEMRWRAVKAVVSALVLFRFRVRISNAQELQCRAASCAVELYDALPDVRLKIESKDVTFRADALRTRMDVHECTNALAGA